MDLFPVARRESSRHRQKAIDWISKAAEEQPRIQEDAKLLKKIVKMDPSEICKRQCCK